MFKIPCQKFRGQNRGVRLLLGDSVAKIEV